MGKRTSFVIWLTMILFWAPGLPAQQAVLSVIGSSGLAGSGGNIVWIDLDNTTAGPVSGLQFDLGFDPGVLSVEQVVRTRRTDSSTMALFDWNVYQEGKLRVVMTGIGTTIAPDTGSIADISFEVAEDALPGDYPLTLSNVLLVDVQTEITDGVFTVAEETVLKVIGGSGVPGSAGNAVPIDLANNIGIGGIAFTLSYDATLLTVTDVEATSKTDHMSTLTWSEPHPGVVNLLIADTAGAIIAPVKGAIAHFHFDVSADAPHGDIGLTLSDVVISDPQGAPVDVISVDGVFTVGVPEIAISDTSHNFGDVQIDNSAIWPFTIYNYGSAALRIDSIAADRSEFGVGAPQFFPQFVAPKDSLQLTLTFIPKVMGTVSAVVSIDTNDPEDRRFYLHVRGNGVAEGTAILIVAGGIGPPGGMGMVVPIELENSVSVAAMQFDLGFDPNLLSISDVARTFRTGADVMDIFSWGEQIPGVVRVVMTGIGHEITPGKGSVADLVFDVAPDALPGDVALSLSNVIVSDRLANPIPTTTVDGVFIVTGDAALRVVGGSGTPGSAHNRVPVDLYNAVEVAKVQFTLNYDTTSLTLSAVIPTARTEGMSTFRWEQSDSGQVTLSVFDNTGLLIELGRGSIADFYFDVAARISFGEVSLALSDVELYDADHSPIDVVSVDGVFTVDLPDINVPVTFHDYGSVAVGSSADWTLTISNKGRVKLNINSISSDNPDFAIATPFPQTIEPGNALGVIVTFTPSTEGAIEGLLSVGSDDPDEGLISVSLAGYGKRPDIDVSATSHNFGEVVVCSSVDWVTTVSNRGSGDLVIDQVSSEIPDFVVTSPHFPQTIPQDSSIDVTVTFMPWTEGEISGDVIIRSDDSDEPEVILYLTGEGIFGEAALMAVGGMFDRASRDNRVSIKLHNGIAVSAVLFTLGYDPDVLTLTNVTPTERSEVMSIFDWSHRSPDQVSVRISDVSGETVGPGTESVADFYFDVSDNAPLGDAELTLTEVVISDSPGEEIPITVVDGVVTVIGDWATLVVGGGSGGAGSRGNLVPIILDNEMEVYGIQFDLDFDTNVLSVTDVMRTERTDSVEIFNWSNIDGGIRVFVVCFYNDIAPGNGAVVDIIFDVTSNAPPCYFPLILSNVEFYDCPVCLAPPTPFSTSNGGFTISTPTLGVQLASFDATWQRGFVVLGWATSTETDLVGFNLYRSLSDAEFEKINTEGLITGSSPYSYIDRSIGQEGTHHYKLGALCSNGQEKIVGTTSVEVTELFPQQYALFQNYPNPFNPTTTIRYAIPSREQRAWSEEQRAESREVSSVSELSALRTTLKVYNILGQEVKTLVNEQLEPGEYSVNWDGRDNSGMNLPSGIYLYRLKAGNYVSTKRMILLK